MNTIDIVLMVLLGIGTLNGIRQGAIAQILGFTSGVAMLLVVSRYAGTIVGFFALAPGILRGLTTLCIVVAALVVGNTIGVFVGRWFHDMIVELGARRTDYALGIFTGFLSTALHLWILSSILIAGPMIGLSQSLTNSQLIAYVEPYLPNYSLFVGHYTNLMDPRGMAQTINDITKTTVEDGANIQPLTSTVGDAEAAGRPSTVKVQASGCALGGIASGIVVDEGTIVTTAHTIAGAELVEVIDAHGRHTATVIYYDPKADIAVLDAPNSPAAPLPFSLEPIGPNTMGASLGYEVKGRALSVRPIAILGGMNADGRDIYGDETVNREVLVVKDDASEGEAGGPVVTDTGKFVGMIFGSYGPQPDISFAIPSSTLKAVLDTVGTVPVNTGACRYAR